MHPTHYFHPILVSLVDELCRSPNPGSAGNSRIYVSRVLQSHFRELSNRNEIEEIAIAEGLTLVKPETLSIRDQVSLFANASLVVGEFGSAMHNTLFSAPDTSVLCLNWINGLQSRIAQLKRHRVGYLLPHNGIPVRYVEGAPRLAYEVDPHTFRRCLRTLISATESPSGKNRTADTHPIA